MPARMIQKELQNGLNSLGDFIRALEISQEPTELVFPYKSFSDEKLGGLSMSGDDARNYRRVLTKVIDATTNNEVMSARWVEKQVQHAILSSLDLVV